MAMTLTLLLGALAVTAPRAGAQGGDKPAGTGPEKEKPKLGLSVNDPKAFQGYTLLAPMMSTKTYLLDMQGRVVRTWESDCNPALSAYLLEDGHLLRPGTLPQQGFGGGPGAGGRVQEFTWDGELVWDFKLVSTTQLPHHDICRLPNGNVLMVVWEKKTAKEALAAGRRPETVGDGFLHPDSILEVQRTGKADGKVVWEWHAWDHLVQDFDSAKENYGDVGAHPELIDLNFGEGVLASMIPKKDELEKLKAIGYVGSAAGKKPPPAKADWTHVNAVAYNPELDQVMLSVHEFSEIWVIDHSTSTAEAASHKGGRSGKGGDLLYRWGNPRAYRAGMVKDQKLFSQHNAHWIPKGLPGAGNILVFNNGLRRPGGAHSTVDEIVPPVDSQGRYAYKPGTAYGPDKPDWSYAAPKRTDFYAALISGAQRLPNGNTLICSGTNGTLFEVTAEKDLVWKYVNPEQPRGGMMPFLFGPPRAGEILPGFLQDTLKMTAEQKKELAELQKEIDSKLEKLLTAEQNKQLKELREGKFGPPGFGGPMVVAPGGPKGFGPGAPVPAPGGGFGGPGGGASVFRSLRYAADYPGLAGKALTPGKTIEELQAKDAPKEPKAK
jgi:hypothetical protein